MKGISGTGLKLIAVLSMFCDHIAYFLLGEGHVLYAPLRCIGRMAFPIFAFLISEGFVHTHSRWRYFVTLLCFALISEVPWQLLCQDDGSHNVMFTLTLGVATLAVIDRMCESYWLSILAVSIIAFLAEALGFDYSFIGILIISVFYLLSPYTIYSRRDDSPKGQLPERLLQILFAIPILLICGISSFLFIPILLQYNCTRGHVSRILKYLFYAIYPGHLFAIWMIK